MSAPRLASNAPAGSELNFKKDLLNKLRREMHLNRCCLSSGWMNFFEQWRENRAVRILCKILRREVESGIAGPSPTLGNNSFFWEMDRVLLPSWK